MDPMFDAERRSLVGGQLEFDLGYPTYEQCVSFDWIRESERRLAIAIRSAIARTTRFTADDYYTYLENEYAAMRKLMGDRNDSRVEHPETSVGTSIR